MASLWISFLLGRFTRYFFLSGGSLCFGGGSGSIGGVVSRLIWPRLYRRLNAGYFIIRLFFHSCEGDSNDIAS